MPKEPVESVTYITDDGRDAFAFVVGSAPSGNLNLAWLDPDTYSLHAANDVAPDRVK